MSMGGNNIKIRTMKLYDLNFYDVKNEWINFMMTIPNCGQSQ